MKCDNGCHQAEFLIKNGEARQYLCEPSFADQIVDLIKSNHTLLLTMEKQVKILVVTLW